MPRATDTAMRYLAILQCIPAYPDSISTRAIADKLEALVRPYDVSPRTLQRDLERLSGVFPLVLDEDRGGRAKHWSWMDPQKWMEVPMMSKTNAFALRLAREHLQPIMPPSVLGLLRSYFLRADSVLEAEDGELGRWQDKVAVITRGPPLAKPEVLDDVQAVVYRALLEDRKLKVNYRGRGEKQGQSIELHPLGIVVVWAGVIYLVAMAWRFEDVRHYAMHRIRSAEMMDEPASRSSDFSLAAYIRDEDAFAYPVSEQELYFRALFDEGAAYHLNESQLASDQRLTLQEDGRVLVEATVKDNANLRWWLLGFGSGVEVLKPEFLRQELREEAQSMSSLYQ